MKRHPLLIDLSQEHHHTLALCVRILREPDKNHQEDINRHYVDLLQHFDNEEHRFAPLWARLQRDDLRNRFEQDHADLRQLHRNARYNDPKWNTEFAERLRDHARFEERELFPLLETLLPTA